MRDRRFVAEHRGGPLGRESHVALARWAGECARGVLKYYARSHSDGRLTEALETLEKWAAGEVRTGAAMAAARAVHVAAREAQGEAAVAAARSVGHAVATAHAADHSMGALLYALKARRAEGLPVEGELELWLARLPEHLRAQMAEGMRARLPGGRGGCGA